MGYNAGRRGTSTGLLLQYKCMKQTTIITKKEEDRNVDVRKVQLGYGGRYHFDAANAISQLCSPFNYSCEQVAVISPSLAKCVCTAWGLASHRICCVFSCSDENLVL
ncbi:unnamed protein product [Lepidochelys kempii]